MAPLHVADGMQAVLGAVLRAVGKPTYHFWSCLIGNYLISIPLGFGLAFGANLELQGLYIGLCAGVWTFFLAVLVSLLRFVDWDKQLEEAARNTS